MDLLDKFGSISWISFSGEILENSIYKLLHIQHGTQESLRNRQSTIYLGHKVMSEKLRVSEVEVSWAEKDHHAKLSGGYFVAGD